MTDEGAGPGVRVLRPCPALYEINKMLLTTRSRSVQEIIRTRDAVMAQNRAMARRQIAPHNPLHVTLPDGAWSGQPCFVIGGGPSLFGFDFERLRGRGRVIAINRAFEFIPWADMLFFMDHKFYKLCHDNKEKFVMWQGFGGHKVFLNLMGRAIDDAYSVRSLGREGVSVSQVKGIYHGNNSGFGAVQMALALGCRPIYLLGYDMGDDPEARGHWHSGYGSRPRPALGKSFVRDFNLSQERFRHFPYIYNANPRSHLRIFPFVNLDEVLNGPARQSMGDDRNAVQEPVPVGPPPAG